MRLIDRIGERYERLLVKERAPNASRTDTNARWRCVCDCGRMVIAYGQDLSKGKVKSCGCYNATRIRTHGMSRSKVSRIWIAMRNRCNNPDNAAYHNYGGRGIMADPSWDDFATFFADMGYPPKGSWLERKDNNGPYSKENCCWATPQEQLNNKRTNRMLTAFGRTQTIAQWSAELGVPWSTIRSRVDRYDWPHEAAVSEPKRQGRKLTE